MRCRTVSLIGGVHPRGRCGKPGCDWPFEGAARVEAVTECLIAWHDEASEEGIASCRALARHIVAVLDGADPYVIAPDEPARDWTKPDVDVCKDERGVWWVTLDGVKVSDHRTHDAARIAARRHQVELMSK